MSDKVSVIVPVYNSVKYLKQCLDSILSQTYRNIEIILVDDGSSDGSSEICDRYKELDNRIIVIHNENHGVSYSRNCGIDKSSGKYIVFVDSDDSIASVYIATLLSANDNSDLVMCNINYIYENQNKIERPQIMEKKLVGNFFTDYYILRPLLSYPVLKLYKSDIIKKKEIRFPEKISCGEDQIFNFKYFNFVTKYKFVNLFLYNYYKRNNQSLGQIRSKKTFQDIVKKIFLEKNFLNERSVPNKEKIISDFVINVMWWYIRDSQNNYTAFKRRVKILKQALIYPYASYTFKRMIVLKCLNWNFYVLLYAYFWIKNKYAYFKYMEKKYEYSN